MPESVAHKALRIFNGRYTCKNRQTGEHRTFEIKTQAEDAKFAAGQRVLSLLTGPNNEADYTGFAFVTEGGIQVWKSKRAPAGPKTAWEWYAEILWSLALDGGFSPFADRFEFLMEGRCVRCNRVLTEPESIKTGIGPVCADRMEAPLPPEEPDFEALWEQHLDQKASRDVDPREEGSL